MMHFEMVVILNMKDVYAGQYSFIRGGGGGVILARNVMCLLAWVRGCLYSLVSTPYGIVMQNDDEGDPGRGERAFGALGVDQVPNDSINQTSSGIGRDNAFV